MAYNIHENWLTYQEVQEIFNYKPTQMYHLLKNKELIVATVGNRKFIRKDSLEAFLMSRAQN
jgi:hypothetical protein